MKPTRVNVSLPRVARILFLVFKIICMLAAVITVACMILTVLLGIGLATYQVASWPGVVFYIFVLLGLFFAYQTS